MLWLLLKNRLTMAFNELLKGDIAKRRRRIFAILGAGFLCYILFQWSYKIFDVLLLQPGNSAIITNLLTLFFSAFFVFLLVTGITISIHYLFISTDLPLLLSTPLSGSTIFSFKLFESIYANSSLFFILGIPVLVSFGVAANVSLLYYPVMIVHVFIFLTLPVSIAFLIAMIFVRFIPAIRAKEILAGVLGIVTLVIWIFLQLFHASQFDSNSSNFNADRLHQITNLSQNTILNFLPTTWAAKFLAGFAFNQFTDSFYNFGSLCLSAILIFLISISVSKSLFQKGLLGAAFEVQLKKKKQSKTYFLSRFQHLFSSTIGSIFWRDVKLITRDLRMFTNVIIFTLMMVLFPLIRGYDQLDTPFDDYLPFLWILMFSALVSSQLTSRLIPFEGKSFWILKVAPQSFYKIFVGKLLAGFTLNLISTWSAVIVTGIFFHSPIRIFIMALIVTALFSFSVSCYGLTIGSLFPKFDWDHPKRMLTSTGLFILNVGILIFSSIWIVLLYVIFTMGNFTPVADIFIIMMCFIITWLTIILGIAISSKKLTNLEWNI